MLTEKNLASADKELSKLYKEIEARILCDIAKTLKAISATTDAQLYQAKILQELGAIRSRVNQYMKKYDKAIQKEVQAIFEKAMKDAMKNDVRAFGKAKGAMSDNQKQLYENLQSQIESVQANSDIANKTFGAIKNLTQSIARGAQKEFIDVANRAFLETATGAFSHTEALKHATNELAEKGIRTIEYQRGGKKINRTIEGAIRENIITGINQASSEQTLRNAALLEVERFQVTSHFGSRPEHEVWQGKIFTKQELYEVCGLGTATGLCGINCRHSYYPYIEGMNGFYSDSDIEAMNEKTVHYKGEQLSQYEAEQKQRAIERSIRKYKTRAMVEASAGLDNTKARAMLGEKQNEMRAFIKETELPREASREHVGNTGAQVRGIKSKILSVDLKFFEKGDIANEYADKVKKDNNMFDVAMHGNESGVKYKNKDRLTSAKELANEIKKDKNFNKKNGVRLLSCATGKGENSFAQKLANELQCEVKAPTENLRIFSNGDFKVLDNGEMVVFKPKKEK